MKKGIKTTITAFVGLLALMGIVVVYLMGEIDTEQLTVALSAVGASLGVIVGFLSKDQNQTHSTPPTFNTTPPPGEPNDPEPDN